MKPQKSKNLTLLLPKRLAWIIFTALLLLDGFLDVVRGAEGNPLWKPLIDLVGTKTALLIVPLVLTAFYLIIKVLAWLVKKADHFAQAEALVLTSLVVVYAVYDLWVIAYDFFGFRLIRNYQRMIPVMLVVGLLYGLLAEYLTKRGNK